jgi:hypothetical protein
MNNNSSEQENTNLSKEFPLGSFENYINVADLAFFYLIKTVQNTSQARL